MCAETRTRKLALTCTAGRLVRAGSVATPLVTCTGIWPACGHPWWWCPSTVVQQVTERKQIHVPAAVRAEVNAFVKLD